MTLPSQDQQTIDLNNSEQQGSDATPVLSSRATSIEIIHEHQLVRPDSNGTTNGIDLEEASSCIICSEPWSNSGEHRVCVLACGHMFGRSCIERWLMPMDRYQIKKCPNCGQPGKAKDIRNVYPIAVIAVDSDKIQALQRQVMVERGLREQKEREIYQLNLSLNMVTSERDRFQNELAQLKSSLPSLRSRCLDQSIQYKWTQHAPHQIQVPGTYRFMTSYDDDKLALTLQTSPDSHSILLYSVAAKATQHQMNGSQLHTKPIRGITTSPPHMNTPFSNHPHILTASLDKSACVLRDTRLVIRLAVPNPALSCCFDSTNGYLCWIGTQNHSVYGFDLRWSAQPVCRLSQVVSPRRGPGIHSLCHVTNGVAGKGTLITSSFHETIAWTIPQFRTSQLFDVDSDILVTPARVPYPDDFEYSALHTKITFPDSVHDRQCYAMEPIITESPTCMQSIAFLFRGNAKSTNVAFQTVSEQGTCHSLYTGNNSLITTKSHASLMNRFAAWQLPCFDRPTANASADSCSMQTFVAVPNEMHFMIDIYTVKENGPEWVTEICGHQSPSPILDVKPVFIDQENKHALVAGINETDVTKQIYHCNECGICRIGKGLHVDQFHCETCNVCMAIGLKDKHVCIGDNLRSDCPKCGQYMFTSTRTVVFMPCGHGVHHKCYLQHIKTSFACPTCFKPLGNSSMYQ